MSLTNSSKIENGQSILSQSFDYDVKSGEHERFQNQLQKSPEFRHLIDYEQKQRGSEAFQFEQNSDIDVTASIVVASQMEINLTGKMGERAIDPMDDPSLAWKFNGQVYNQGPDQILPSTAIRTWQPDGATRISQVDTQGAGSHKPISVPSLLRSAAERAPNRPALATKRDGEWKKWTYSEYLQDSRTIAKAFIALGLERFQSVCILGFNAPEWFQADMGAIFAGGFGVGIYSTNSPDAIAHCALDSRAKIFVVEDEKMLSKVLQIKSQLTCLNAIVQYTGQPTEEGVLSWTQLLELGAAQKDDLLEERLKLISINQCCSLIYTSGTTGNPKGVMLSHDNLTWTAYSNSIWCEFQECKDDIVSFLPLSHVAAQMADIYSAMTWCTTVYFADKNALKGSLIDTLREVNPTKFLAVPRVWEKMYEKMQEVGRETKGPKKIIAKWAKKKGLEYTTKRMNGISQAAATTFEFQLANKLVLSKIRAALGFSKCPLLLSGAAPLSQEILRYFMSLNIIVGEAFGMSECSGPHGMAIEAAFRIGSCGKAIPGTVTSVDKPDSEGNGEILIGGRHVFMGYLHQPERTATALDENGYLHSEDMGHVDDDGFIFITGRLKELLITAGGENVAPVPIEDRVKHMLPCVSQAVLIGDRLKFLSILLTLKTEVDKDTQEPLNTLLPFTKDWIEQHENCQVNTVQDVQNQLYIKYNQRLRQAFQAGIDAANAESISQAQKIQKWHLLPLDFSMHGGELGPTLKLKRQTVYQKYKSIIENLYR